MIKILVHARVGYAELVSHTGKHACRVGGEAYLDHSRTSVVCPAHREEYKRRMAARRGKRRITKRVSPD